MPRIQTKVLKMNIFIVIFFQTLVFIIGLYNTYKAKFDSSGIAQADATYDFPKCNKVVPYFVVSNICIGESRSFNVFVSGNAEQYLKLKTSQSYH